uniref:Zinc finger, CCHC-type n=1 Tax=Tanacetum cinerariifolium TaxID=118510 RepID=A0A6L2L0V6_TANCI|nr:zinc finger, CCHC-type [Tanacetum cinerariifolium]
MGNEELSTIPEKKSDEFIKSSVENLVPIPSEFEDTSENDSEYDLSLCNDFSSIDVLEGKSVIFSNPLSDSNNDFTSSNDESLSDEDVPENKVKINSNPLFEFDDKYISIDVNPLLDEVLENIENRDSYDSNVDKLDLLVTSLSDANDNECYDPCDDVDDIELLLHCDPSTPKMSVASILEGYTSRFCQCCGEIGYRFLTARYRCLGSITTWEDLTTCFLASFFPPRRTVKLCNDILMFQQHHGESLSEAWTRFKDLLQKVPHHGIDLWLYPYRETGAQKKGNQNPSKLFSPEYLSPASIIELNKNPSAPKCVHFVNSIVILSEESKFEEGETTIDITPKHSHNITKEAKNEVKEVIDEEESEVETDEEIKEILKEEEEDEDGKYFNSFPTMKELTHHEWLLKNPRPP